MDPRRLQDVRREARGHVLAAVEEAGLDVGRARPGVDDLLRSDPTVERLFALLVQAPGEPAAVEALDDHLRMVAALALGVCRQAAGTLKAHGLTASALLTKAEDRLADILRR